MKYPVFPRFFIFLICSISLLGSGFISGCTSLFRPYEKRAQALLLPTVDNAVNGSVTFIEYADGMQVSYSLKDLLANHSYGFQIHQYGDCNARDARSAGPIFALSSRQLNKHATDPEGKMPNIRSDANGVATGFVVVSDLSLDGIRSVINRSIIVLHIEDNSSATKMERLACGVIRRQ